MSEPITVFGFNEKDLMSVDSSILRTLVHERAHHTIEVSIYRIMASKMEAPANYGDTVDFLLGIWRRRNCPWMGLT